MERAKVVLLMVFIAGLSSVIAGFTLNKKSGTLFYTTTVYNDIPDGATIGIKKCPSPDIYFTTKPRGRATECGCKF